VERSEDLARSIRMEIVELPGTMFGDILKLDNTPATFNMTVLTDLEAFDSSSEAAKSSFKN
jgi:hypothetical protein